MTAQNKAVVNVYVHEHSCTEQPRDGVDYTAVQHAYSHPDCVICIWRGGMVSISGKRDAVRHTLLTALVAAGVTLSALRDHRAGKKRVATEADASQLSLL